MKQLRKRLPMYGIVDTIEDRPTAKLSLIPTDSTLPIRHPAQVRTMMPEFIVRQADSTNAASKFLLDRRNDWALRTAKRPVLLCKGGGRACYRKILVPVDFTNAGKIAADIAISCFPFAQIVFLHAFQGPENSVHDASHSSGDVCSRRLSSREQAMMKLEHLTKEFPASDNLVSRVAQYGSTFSVIVNYAARMDAELILIGAREHLSLKDLLFGSVASRIANCTEADVLVVPRRMSKQGVSLAVSEVTSRDHPRMTSPLSYYKL